MHPRLWYPRLWRTTVALLTAVGLMLLWWRQPVLTTLIVPLAGAFGWGLVMIWRWTVAEEGDPPPEVPSFRTTFALTSAALGMLGLMVLDAGLGFLALAAVALSSPPVVRRFLPATNHPPPHPPPAPSPVPTHVEDVGPEVDDLLTGLSDSELCRAWRHSFAVLHETDPVHRLSVVQLRAACLDEMTRRHPREVENWLASGGRAASGPDRFFSDSE